MYEELMEQVVSQENATVAWKAVKGNKGAAGCRVVFKPGIFCS